jgi:hypothetical protein
MTLYRLDYLSLCGWRPVGWFTARWAEWFMEHRAVAGMKYRTSRA